jgi:dethiobiotin synthetase
MTVLVVTGTSTDVGKTVATAALAACATGRVAVVKPAQTGVATDEPGDLAEVRRLSGCTDTHEFARYPDPLSPHHAARVSGLPALALGAVVARIATLGADRDLVLVEGAGGLLVPFDEAGWTVLDLAGQLGADVLLVTTAGLGTINHTALTVRAIEAAAVSLAGIVIGSWPASPGLAERCNVDDLSAMSPHGALAGVLPERMASMGDFAVRARAALAPQLGGTFDWREFRANVHT